MWDFVQISDAFISMSDRFVLSEIERVSNS